MGLFLQSDSLSVAKDALAEAVPVEKVFSFTELGDNNVKMTKIEIVCKDRMLEPLKNAMLGIGITGMTVSHVMGCGLQKGKPEHYRGVEIEPSLLPKNANKKLGISFGIIKEAGLIK